nr:MAG TPA: hypothetical protein [Caudoviricetes sp.]
MHTGRRGRIGLAHRPRFGWLVAGGGRFHVGRGKEETG